MMKHGGIYSFSHQNPLYPKRGRLFPPNSSRPLNPERSKKSGNCNFLFDPKLEGSLVDERGLCREVLFWRCGARELRGTTETLTEAGLSADVVEIDDPPEGTVLIATGTSAGGISTSCNGGGNWGAAVNVNTVGLGKRPGSLAD